MTTPENETPTPEEARRPRMCSIAELIYVDAYVLPGLHAAANTVRAGVIDTHVSVHDRVRYRVVPAARLDKLHLEQRIKLYGDYVDSVRTGILQRPANVALKRPLTLARLKTLSETYLVDHATYMKRARPELDHDAHGDAWVRLSDSIYYLERWRDAVAASHAATRGTIDLNKPAVMALDTAKDLNAMVDDEIYQDPDVKTRLDEVDVSRVLSGAHSVVDAASVDAWVRSLMDAHVLQLISLSGAQHGGDGDDAALPLSARHVLCLWDDFLAILRAMDYIVHCGDSAHVEAETRGVLLLCIKRGSDFAKLHKDARDALIRQCDAQNCHTVDSDE